MDDLSGRTAMLCSAMFVSFFLYNAKLNSFLSHMSFLCAGWLTAIFQCQSRPSLDEIVVIHDKIFFLRAYRLVSCTKYLVFLVQEFRNVPPYQGYQLYTTREDQQLTMRRERRWKVSGSNCLVMPSTSLAFAFTSLASISTRFSENLVGNREHESSAVLRKEL